MSVEPIGAHVDYAHPIYPALPLEIAVGACAMAVLAVPVKRKIAAALRNSGPLAQPG